MLVASGKQPSGAYTKLSMAAVSEVYVGAYAPQLALWMRAPPK